MASPHAQSPLLSGPVPVGERPMPLVPRSMDEAMALARAVVASRMAPRGMETPEACMIAILHGLEVGLTPLMALQRIALVEGRPTIWGDGAMALVRASGLCRSVKEWVEGETPEAWVATCEVQRKGETDPVVRQFGVEDAKRAGLWGRPGPWSTYPRRMLQMRARAFALRDVFADVLGGLYLREEIEDETEASVKREAPVSGRAPEMGGSSTGTPASKPSLAAAKGKSEGNTSVRPARVRRSSAWVRLRAPREAIRLRAPAPPGYEPVSGSKNADSGGLSISSPARRRGAPRQTQTARHRFSEPKEILTLLDDALACALDQATLTEVEEEFALRLQALPGQAAADAARILGRHRDRVSSLSKGGEPCGNL